MQVGFTLIELSIVLVIIGLIVGGILVGQDLIRAASVRAQITQIEKFNIAANTFRDKYGYLPGDIKDPDASSFGFVARGSQQGQGDGDGVLMGYAGSAAVGTVEGSGETVMFWVDLSKAHLIEGTFTTASPSVFINPVFSGFEAWFPTAKIGQGNFVYAYSQNSVNYFGISVVTKINSATTQSLSSSQGMTILMASAIDNKVDDGLAQLGRVTAQYVTYYPTTGDHMWSAAAGGEGANNYHGPTTAATAGDPTTCYDNSSTATGTPGVGGAAQHYSVEIAGGANVNCGLSFRFQ